MDKLERDYIGACAEHETLACFYDVKLKLHFELDTEKRRQWAIAIVSPLLLFYNPSQPS